MDGQMDERTERWTNMIPNAYCLWLQFPPTQTQPEIPLAEVAISYVYPRFHTISGVGNLGLFQETPTHGLDLFTKLGPGKNSPHPLPNVSFAGDLTFISTVSGL